MTAIDRTAYPRPGTRLTREELDEQYALTDSDLDFIQANARREPGRLLLGPAWHTTPPWRRLCPAHKIRDRLEPATGFRQPIFQIGYTAEMPVRTTLKLAAISLVLAPGMARAEQLAAELRLVNATPGRIECHAEAAHWYGFDLGTFAAGDTLLIRLLFDPATKTVGRRDEIGGMLPIETLYCGRAAHAYETRFVLGLRALAARAASGEAVTLSCRDAGDAVTCD